METSLMERAWIDIHAAPRGVTNVTHLTDASAVRWSGVVELAPQSTLSLDAGKRHDLYVLRGTVELDGYSLAGDDFLLHCGSASMRAGERGARLLLYREPCDSCCDSRCDPRCDPSHRAASTRIWQQGRNPRMKVASLAGGSHQLSLVAWQPGARTRDHAHPRGEEIVVLRGELRDGDARYPAGTWLRLHPGASHEPFAEVPTTILLRHGHLPRDV